MERSYSLKQLVKYHGLICSIGPIKYGRVVLIPIDLTITYTTSFSMPEDELKNYFIDQARDIGELKFD